MRKKKRRDIRAGTYERIQGQPALVEAPASRILC